MNLEKQFLTYALFISAFFLSHHLVAQNNVLNLLPGSKKANYFEANDLLKLEGDVIFEYQNNVMYCDSAYYYEKAQFIRGYGNVHIIKENLNIFCDSAFFNAKAERSKLWGRVKMRDGDYKLTTDSIDYDSATGRATYRNYGAIQKINSKERITSKVGYFYPDTKNYYFQDSVRYTNDGLKMQTDTLQFDYSEHISYFFGHTFIEKDSIDIQANYGWFNTQTNEGYLHGNAMFTDPEKTLYADTIIYIDRIQKIEAKHNVHFIEQKNNLRIQSNYLLKDEASDETFVSDCVLAQIIQESDTIYIHSDTLSILSDTIDSKQKLYAYYDVRIYNTQIQAKCDSLSYIELEELMTLYEQPIIWSDNAELKGDSIQIHFTDSLINHIDIYENASAVMELDSGALYNQISGKSIIALMEKGKLVKTDVKGTATSIFYPEDEEITDSSTIIKRLGLNKLEASALTVHLDSGEVKGITYRTEPTGIFYPIDQINEKDRWIKNFKWNPILRPKDYSTLDN
ncbi:MAG: OstA-like protein [Crocinitomicaceae bacterium]